MQQQLKDNGPTGFRKDQGPTPMYIGATWKGKTSKGKGKKGKGKGRANDTTAKAAAKALATTEQVDNETLSKEESASTTIARKEKAKGPPQQQQWLSGKGRGNMLQMWPGRAHCQTMPCANLQLQ